MSENTDFRTLIDQKLRDLRAIDHRGLDGRSSVIQVANIQIGTAIDQHLEDAHVALVGSPDDGGTIEIENRIIDAGHERLVSEASGHPFIVAFLRRFPERLDPFRQHVLLQLRPQFKIVVEGDSELHIGQNQMLL